MTYSSFCIVYSTIGVDRNRLNSNGRSILYCALAGCPNSAAARSRPCARIQGHLHRRRRAVPVLAPTLEIISVGSSSLPSSKTVNGEESWRRSNDSGQGGDLEEEHIDDASPVPKRWVAQSPPWRHRPPGRLLRISAPAARGETNRVVARHQLLGEA
jgi:hypothetical protein